MKAAIITPNNFFDSAAVSLTPTRRYIEATRISRRALLRIEDRAGHIMEVTLRFILGASVLAGFFSCAWQAAQH